MATPIVDGDKSFRATDSSVLPSELQAGMVSRSVNMLLRGGIASARPGFDCQFSFSSASSDSSGASSTTQAELLFQGAQWFYPITGTPVLLFVVSGTLYRSDYPYRSHSTVGAFFDTTATCYFTQALQTNSRNVDGSITLTDPRVFMVIQDGRKTPPVVFDGSTAVQQRGTGSIPHGSVMIWAGSRLWVAQGPKLIPSDIGNPVSFWEPYDSTVAIPLYLVFPGDITALAMLPGRNDQLLVFTSRQAEVIYVGIRDRSTWLSTQGFQQEVFNKVGCVAHRSLIEHHGLLWWYSQYGLVNFDVAQQASVTSVLPYQDNEMLWQKGQLSDDLSGISCATYENFFLLSCPVNTLDNSNTWVLDQSSRLTMEGKLSGWSSSWNGLHPIEWVSLRSEQQPRLFCFDQQDGELRLWEAFGPDQLDEGCPFEWWMETRGYDGEMLMNDKEARYARVDLVELQGTVDIAVFWSGENRGRYQRIAQKRFEAQQSVFGPGQTYTPTSQVWMTKPQSRRLITSEIRIPSTDDCSVESQNLPFRDESFQLVVAGMGPGGVRAIRLQLDPVDGQNRAGQCTDDELQARMVRADGLSLSGTSEDLQAQSTASPMIGYSAQVTRTVTADEIATVGSADGFSIVSQQAADRQADNQANRIAARQLEELLLTIVSNDGIVY